MPGSPGRQLGAVVADDVELCPTSARADGARVREPLLGVAVDEPVALGARVVLVQHRTPPLDHLRASPSTGHGAAAWMHTFSDDRSYFARTSGGSLSMRMNIVGTNCVVVTL